MIGNDQHVSARTVIAGSQSYSVAGSHSFVVPEYNTLTIDLQGPTGGGGYANDGLWGSNSSAGSGSAGSPASTITSLSLVANPGGGGGGAYYADTGPPFSYNGGTGTAGTATGGTVNTTGGSVANGGSPQTDNVGTSGGPGGKGGRAQKTYAYGDAGAPVPGTTLTIVLGAAGAGFNSGSPGRCNLSWS